MLLFGFDDFGEDVGQFSRWRPANQSSFQNQSWETL